MNRSKILFCALLVVVGAMGAGAPVRESRATSVEELTFTNYIPLSPALIVNLSGGGDRLHFVKVGVELYVREPPDAAVANENMPLIRDRLIRYFGGRDYDEVSDVSKREQLREGALHEVQQALIKQTGKVGVTGLYFDDFIIQ